MVNDKSCATRSSTFHVHYCHTLPQHDDAPVALGNLFLLVKRFENPFFIDSQSQELIALSARFTIGIDTDKLLVALKGIRLFNEYGIINLNKLRLGKADREFADL